MTAIRILRKGRSEKGFTLVELLLAMVLTAIGIAATLSVFGASGRTTLIAQRSEVAAHKAQAEVDDLVSRLEYGELAMTSTPTASTDPKNPNYRLTGSDFKVRSDLTEPLVTTAGSGATPKVEPGPDDFRAEAGSSTITGKIYRYVTWRNEPGCFVNGIDRCPTDENTKRVIVAITIDPSPNTSQRNPLWFSTLVNDPSAAPPGYTGSGGGGGGGGTNTSAQIFYLYDTPCGETSRQAPSANHSTRSTAQTSALAAEYSTCRNSDRALNPDLMAPDPPGGTDPPLYDYSDDLTGDYPGGLAMRRRGATCPTTGYAAADASREDVPSKWSVHAWSTNEFADPASPGGFAGPFNLSGRATVSIYTTTLGGAPGRGTLCATLIERIESDGTVSDPTVASTTDTTLASTTYDLSSWPTTPRRLSFTFDVSPAVDIDPGHRLVLVLHLREESTNDIAILYDHPDYKSLLELETSTPLGG